MSYGIHTKHVHKKLKLDKGANSTNWYARLTLDNGKRIVRSMKTEDFEHTKPEMMLGRTYSTTLNSSTIPNASTLETGCCRLLTSKTDSTI